MKSSVAAAEQSPLGLRAFHALVFLGFGAGAIAGVFPELRQLVVALAHDWHSGTPPSPLGLAASLSAFGLSVALVVYLVRGRSAPLWMSIAMLAAFAGSFLAQSYEFGQRSAPGANLQMLGVGKALNEKMRVQLQDHGSVPKLKTQWEQALAAVADELKEPLSPYRRRTFLALPWKLETLVKEGDFLTDAQPGTFCLWMPEDASRFSLTMIGLDAEHQPVRLRDDHGEVFELKGVYNPDTRR